jgi:thiamine biosynthesis lipoprotein
VTLLGVAWLAIACAPPDSDLISIGGSTMGTTYTVKLRAMPRSLSPEALAAQIARRLERVERLLSTYDPDSELSRFNRSPSTDWFEVSPDTATVVAAARAISERSDGAFDVTVGALVNLWGFGPGGRTAAVPDAAAIEAARALTGYRHLAVRLEPPALKKADARLYVDLSSIGDGFGVDRIADLLDRAGIRDYLVEIGGELRARGLNPDGLPWRVGIERPGMPPAVQRVVALDGLALSTSGDYRNYFEQDGVRYSHVIDPGTGRPVAHDTASVTVVHARAMIADGWSTALLVLGLPRGLALAEEAGLAALFLVRDGDGYEEQASAAFESLPSPGAPRGATGAERPTGRRSNRYQDFK